MIINKLKKKLSRERFRKTYHQAQFIFMNTGCIQTDCKNFGYVIISTNYFNLGKQSNDLIKTKDCHPALYRTLKKFKLM